MDPADPDRVVRFLHRRGVVSGGDIHAIGAENDLGFKIAHPQQALLHGGMHVKQALVRATAKQPKRTILARPEVERRQPHCRYVRPALTKDLPERGRVHAQQTYLAARPANDGWNHIEPKVGDGVDVVFGLNLLEVLESAEETAQIIE